ncbi:MAG TPA: hypothetical protein VLT83_12060 [Opitutaceae bacterium]|nr:hypothetical protein [Opitutaceae bacterium]
MLTLAAQAQTPPVVKATGVTPDPATRLAPGQSLNVRIVYESAQPLRFQAAGYLAGVRNGRLAMNPSPVYPAGKGEAIAWLFGQPGARIDEIRVRVCDDRWRQLFEVRVPVKGEWHAGVPAAPEAPWALELSAVQQRGLNQTMAKPGKAAGILEKLWFALTTVLVPLVFLAVPGYPALQVYALVRLRGPARLLSALPLSFMLPVYAFCLYGLSQESNLWPLYAIFASPVAFLITLAVLLVARRRQKAGASAPAPVAGETAKPN